MWAFPSSHTLAAEGVQRCVDAGTHDQVDGGMSGDEHAPGRLLGQNLAWKDMLSDTFVQVAEAHLIFGQCILDAVDGQTDHVGHSFRLER